MPSKPADETTLQAEVAATAAELARLLAKLQSPTLAPNASREEREAARWFYEQIINWRGLLMKRTLTHNVEFLISPNQPAGWYYRNPDGSRTWLGPFPSHKAARTARDECALAAALDATLAGYEEMMA